MKKFNITYVCEVSKTSRTKQVEAKTGHSARKEFKSKFLKSPRIIAIEEIN